MSSAPVLMTTAEYAQHRRVSDSYVRRLRREGRLVEGAGKLIDVAASDAVLDATTDPTRGGDRSGKPAFEAAPSPGAPTATVQPLVAGVDLREAMRRERLAKAQLAELELGEQARQLTRVRDIDRELVTLVRQALERMRTIGSRLRGALANETNPRACEELIDKEVRLVADEMQAAARALLVKVGQQGEPSEEAA